MIKFKQKKIELLKTSTHKDILDISLEEACNYLNVGIQEIGNLLREKEIELNVTSLCMYKFRKFRELYSR